jgi:hypothetical protein
MEKALQSDHKTVTNAINALVEKELIEKGEQITTSQNAVYTGYRLSYSGVAFVLAYSTSLKTHDYEKFFNNYMDYIKKAGLDFPALQKELEPDIFNRFVRATGQVAITLALTSAGEPKPEIMALMVTSGLSGLFSESEVRAIKRAMKTVPLIKSKVSERLDLVKKFWDNED